MTNPPSSALTTAYPSLASLSPEYLDSIRTQGLELSVPAGSCIFDEHMPCKGFPFVLEGSVRVVKQAPSGRELPLYRVSKGETCVLSTSCLLGQQAYNARGIAETDCRLLVLPHACFESLLAAPPFRRFVFELFSQRIADLMEILDEVAFKRLDQRLAGLLLGKGRELHTTHQQLADDLGSAREIVSRLLKGFADQGLVQLSRERIEIIDPAGLRTLAGGYRQQGS